LTRRQKLLVIGASGLTGYKVIRAAKKRFVTYGTYNYRKVEFSDCELEKLDITKLEDVKAFVELIKPDIIINTSALHNVDYCETHRDEAKHVNVDAVRNLAEVTDKIGGRLVHISTDFVFDGAKGNYTESDEPRPLSYYAVTKLEGERAVQAVSSSYIIIRPSVVYGWTPLESAQSISSSGKPMNFALWCVTKLSNKEEIKALTDQYTSPTLADNLADAVLELAQIERNGIYHVSGLSCLNRYDFVLKLAMVMGFNSALVKPVTTDQFTQIAKRPRNSCLDCSKARKELTTSLLTAEESLRIMKQQIEMERPVLLPQAG
jgi:dTDP-4-dehydrorhamnose reductase